MGRSLGFAAAAGFVVVERRHANGGNETLLSCLRDDVDPVAVLIQLIKYVSLLGPELIFSGG